MDGIIKVETETMQVLYSNRICCFDNNSITLSYNFTEQDKLTVIFKFHYDNSTIGYKFSNPENGVVVVDLFNFNNQLGSGTKQSISIGNYNEKKIYLSFFVFKFPEANPLIDVTIYLEK